MYICISTTCALERARYTCDFVYCVGVLCTYVCCMRMRMSFSVFSMFHSVIRKEEVTVTLAPNNATSRNTTQPTPKRIAFHFHYNCFPSIVAKIYGSKNLSQNIIPSLSCHSKRNPWGNNRRKSNEEKIA